MVSSTKRNAVFMDNQKFGKFILDLRKEKGWTQLELAKKLNVTDKAVSKWERGVGFPDIQMIEPLAETLDVSILEIMRSEKMNKQPIPMENANEAVNNVMEVVACQKKIERRNILITITAFALIVLLIFLIDTMQWEGFVMICLPIILLGTGIYLIGLSIYRSDFTIPSILFCFYDRRAYSYMTNPEGRCNKHLQNVFHFTRLI